MTKEKEIVENNKKNEDNTKKAEEPSRKEMVSCEYCGKQFDTMKQVRGHQMRCTVKQEQIKSKIAEEESRLNELGQSVQKERVPFDHVEQKMVVNDKDPDFRYRFINAEWETDPQRMVRANSAYYEVVDHPMNGTTVGQNKNGSDIKVYLHRVPREFYDEDRKREEDKRKGVDEQIRQGKTGQEDSFSELKNMQTGKSAVVPIGIKYNT